MGLTLAAAIGGALAILCLYAALLTFRLSRASGWRDQRWLAMAAISAAVYIAGDIPQTLDASMTTILMACRMQMVAASTCVLSWLYFSTSSLKLENRHTQFAFAVMLGLCSCFALFPGGLFKESELLTVHVHWAGLTYRMGDPTNACLVMMLLGCVAVFICAFRHARAFYRGRRESGWHALALIGFLLAAANDSLITAGVYTSVILIDFFYLLPVAAVVLTQTSALVQISLNLEKANTELVEALRAANEATRLKGEFLANVSHELRTPLNSIINVPEGLLEMFTESTLAVCASCGDRFMPDADAVFDSSTECPSCAARGRLALQRGTHMDADPADVADHLRQLVRAGRHLLGVVDDILDFSKLEAGRMSLQLEELSAKTLLTDLEEFIAPIASRRQVKLAFRSQPDNFVFRGDPRKCLQILMNLTSNAVKFSQPGDSVEVEMGEHDGGQRFVVRDHGVGIAPENQGLVFEAFRQVDGSHTRAVGGTGLGLSVVRKLVDLHGGSIALDSALGRGTTFTVWLPGAH